MAEKLTCAISVLDKFKNKINKNRNISPSIRMIKSKAIDDCINELRKNGFIQVSNEELAIIPLPKVIDEETNIS